jgi:hypothetical protein
LVELVEAVEMRAAAFPDAGAATDGAPWRLLVAAVAPDAGSARTASRATVAFRHIEPRVTPGTPPASHPASK